MSNFLDEPNDNVKPPFKPKRKSGRFYNESALTQEQRDEELNNMDRSEVTEDFGDSPFSDRV
tara:strand:+ start:101 stop:286 length:186 start_codon:yes stop_codon:yes gene_type:complete